MVMVKLTERQERPTHIDPWGSLADPRLGASFAKSYIGWHKEMAEAELDALEAHRALKVHSVWTEDDGWCDGFTPLHAVVETKTGKLLKIKWHDGSQAFAKRYPAGSWCTLSEVDLT